MDGTQSFREIVKLLIENGLQSTLILFFLSLIFGLILGMIIAKGRMSKLLIIQMPIRFFLLIMRGTPLILQLYGFYFGLYYIAGLSLDRMPSFVVENTPKYLRRSKVPVVKAKVGPKIMTFMCDASIFPQVPIKKEVKATVSGIYITSVRGIRGPLEAPEKKKGFMARLKEKAGK